MTRVPRYHRALRLLAIAVALLVAIRLADVADGRPMIPHGVAGFTVGVLVSFLDRP